MSLRMDEDEDVPWVSSSTLGYICSPTDQNINKELQRHAEIPSKSQQRHSPGSDLRSAETKQSWRAKNHLDQDSSTAHSQAALRTPLHKIRGLNWDHTGIRSPNEEPQLAARLTGEGQCGHVGSSC